MKWIFDKTFYNESDVETTIVVYSYDHVFRRVDISETDNQCLYTGGRILPYFSHMGYKNVFMVDFYLIL